MPALAASVVTTLSNQAASGAGTRTPIRVTLSETLPEECAAAAPIIERVRARTDRIVQVTGDDADAHVRLRVHREGERLMGELTIEEGAGRTQRAVSAPTCDDVVAAFAVMLVVALDPDAQALLPSAEAPLEGEPEPSRKPEPEPEPEPRSLARSPRPRPVSVPPKLRKDPPFQLSGGVGFALPAYEGVVFEHHMLLELRLDASLHPRVRAAFARTAHDSIETPSDRVDLVWTHRPRLLLRRSGMASPPSARALRRLSHG